MKKKPYFVELKITAVVMATSITDAMVVAKKNAHDIFFDGELSADEAEEVKSLEHLQRLCAAWDGRCTPYGGDGNTRLKDLLPETEAPKDTKTADMFA